MVWLPNPMHLGKIRQTLRRLWKSRGFSFSVILTLGLGIGATAAVFSIIYAVLLRPLPYSKSAELMSISLSTTPKSITFTPKKTGKYPFECTHKLLFFKSHKDQGMHGILEVVD